MDFNNEFLNKNLEKLDNLKFDPKDVVEQPKRNNTILSDVHTPNDVVSIQEEAYYNGIATGIVLGAGNQEKKFSDLPDASNYEKFLNIDSEGKILTTTNKETGETKGYYPYWSTKHGKYLPKECLETPEEHNKTNAACFSAYGINKLSDGWFVSLTKDLANAVTLTQLEKNPLGLKSVALGFLEGTSDLVEATANFLSKGEFKSDDNGPLDEWNKEQRDKDNLYSIPKSKLALKGIGEVEGLASMVGQGLGFLAQTAATGSALTKVLGGVVGVGSKLAVATEANLAYQAAKQGVNAANLAKLGQTAEITMAKYAKSADFVRNMSQWGSGMIINYGESYNAGKNAGLSDEASAILGLSTGFLNTAIEQKIGTNVMLDFITGNKTNRKLIAETLLQETKKTMTKEALDKAEKNVVNKVMGKITDFTEKLQASRLGQAVESGIEEGTEEFLQTLVGKTGEVVYDNIIDSLSPKEKNAKFGTEFFSKETWGEAFSSSAIGFIIGAGGGALAFKKNKDKEKLLNARILAGATDSAKDQINILSSNNLISKAQANTIITDIDNKQAHLTKLKEIIPTFDSLKEEEQLDVYNTYLKKQEDINITMQAITLELAILTAELDIKKINEPGKDFTIEEQRIDNLKNELEVAKDNYHTTSLQNQLNFDKLGVKKSDRRTKIEKSLTEAHDKIKNATDTSFVDTILNNVTLELGSYDLPVEREELKKLKVLAGEKKDEIKLNAQNKNNLTEKGRKIEALKTSLKNKNIGEDTINNLISSVEKKGFLHKNHDLTNIDASHHNEINKAITEINKPERDLHFNNKLKEVYNEIDNKIYKQISDSLDTTFENIATTSLENFSSAFDDIANNLIGGIEANHNEVLKEKEYANKHLERLFYHKDKLIKEAFKKHKDSKTSDKNFKPVVSTNFYDKSGVIYVDDGESEVGGNPVVTKIYEENGKVKTEKVIKPKDKLYTLKISSDTSPDIGSNIIINTLDDANRLYDNLNTNGINVLTKKLKEDSNFLSQIKWTFTQNYARSINNLITALKLEKTFKDYSKYGLLIASQKKLDYIENWLKNPTGKRVFVRGRQTKNRLLGNFTSNGIDYELAFNTLVYKVKPNGELEEVDFGKIETKEEIKRLISNVYGYTDENSINTIYNNILINEELKKELEKTNPNDVETINKLVKLELIPSVHKAVVKEEIPEEITKDILDNLVIVNGKIVIYNNTDPLTVEIGNLSIEQKAFEGVKTFYKYGNNSDEYVVIQLTYKSDISERAEDLKNFNNFTIDEQKEIVKKHFKTAVKEVKVAVKVSLNKEATIQIANEKAADELIDLNATLPINKNIHTNVNTNTNNLPINKRITPKKTFQFKNNYGKKVIKGTLEKIAKKFKSKFGIKTKFINDSSQNFKGKLENDVAVINLAYATLDTPIHEIIGHPFIFLIKNKNPALYNNLIKELNKKENKDLVDFIDKTYSNLTQEEKEEEAIVQLLSMLIADKIDSKKTTLISILKDFLKELKKWFNSVFDIKLDVSNINENLDLNALSDLLLDNEFKGIANDNRINYSLLPIGINMYLTSQQSRRLISEALVKIWDTKNNNSLNLDITDIIENVYYQMQKNYNVDTDFYSNLPSTLIPLYEDYAYCFTEPSLKSEVIAIITREYNAIAKNIKETEDEANESQSNSNDFIKSEEEKQMSMLENYSTNYENVGNEGSLSKKARLYLQLIVSEEKDDFGRDIKVFLDKSKIYNILQRGLEGVTSDEEFFSKLEQLANYDSDIYTFRTKFLYDINKLDSTLLQNANQIALQNTIISAFTTFKKEYINLVNVKDNVKIINQIKAQSFNYVLDSFVYTTKKILLDLQNTLINKGIDIHDANNIKEINKEITNVYQTPLRKLYGIFDSNITEVSDYNFNNVVNEVIRSFKAIGLNIPAPIIKLSLLHSYENNVQNFKGVTEYSESEESIEIKRKVLEENKEFFEEFYNINYITSENIGDLNSIINSATKETDLNEKYEKLDFVNTEYNKPTQKGWVRKNIDNFLKDIAESITLFDNTFVSPVVTGSDNIKKMAFQRPSFNVKKMNEIKNLFRKLAKTNEDNYLNIANKINKFYGKSWEFIKNNLYFNDPKALSGLEIYAVQSLVIDKVSKDFADFAEEDFLAMDLALMQNVFSKTVDGHTYYYNYNYIKVLEASNSADVITLPVENYITGKPLRNIIKFDELTDEIVKNKIKNLYDNKVKNGFFVEEEFDDLDNFTTICFIYRDFLKKEQEKETLKNLKRTPLELKQDALYQAYNEFEKNYKYAEEPNDNFLENYFNFIYQQLERIKRVKEENELIAKGEYNGDIYSDYHQTGEISKIINKDGTETINFTPSKSANRGLKIQSGFEYLDNQILELNGNKEAIKDLIKEAVINEFNTYKDELEKLIGKTGVKVNKIASDANVETVIENLSNYANVYYNNIIQKINFWQLQHGDLAIIFKNTDDTFKRFKISNGVVNQFKGKDNLNIIITADPTAFIDADTLEYFEKNPNDDIKQEENKKEEKSDNNTSVEKIDNQLGDKNTKPVVKKSRFNPNDKVLKKGSVVSYNGETYLFWNETEKNKAQLIKTDGTKFSGTPNIDKLTILGSYKTTVYNNAEYIVTDKNNIYSGKTGDIVYAGEDNSSIAQKKYIINQVIADMANESDNNETTTETTETTDLNNNIEQKETVEPIKQRNIKKIDKADAQAYYTTSFFIKNLTDLGLVTNEGLKLLQKIEDGEELTTEEIFEENGLFALGLAFNPQKDLITSEMFAGKMSGLILTKRLTSYNPKENGKPKLNEKGEKVWLPKRGFEELHKIRETLEAKNADMLMFPTAAKMAKPNVGKLETLEETKVNNFDREIMGRQVNNPVGKTKIIDPTQMCNLITTELADTPEMKALINAYEKFTEELRQKRFDKLYNILHDELGNVNLAPFFEKVIKEAENSHIDFTTLEFLKNFNPNLPNITQKIENYLFTWFKSAFSIKVKGAKLVFASDYGIKVTVDENDNVVDTESIYKYGTEKEIEALKNYKTRSLKYPLPSNNIDYIEILIPRQTADLAGVRIGDYVNSDVFKGIGTRVPHGGKHAMGVFKVVGFLPTEYGNTVVVPSQVHFLAGSDFDIDAWYVEFFNYLKTNEGLKVATEEIIGNRDIDATNKEIENVEIALRKAKEIVKDLNAEVEDLSVFVKSDLTEIKKALAEQTNLENKLKNLKAFKKVLESDGLLENKLLQSKIDLYNATPTEVKFSPESQELIEEVVNADEFKQLLGKAKPYNMFSPLGTTKTLQKIKGGSKGIGIAANGLKVYKFLSVNNVQLNTVYGEHKDGEKYCIHTGNIGVYDVNNNSTKRITGFNNSKNLDFVGERKHKNFFNVLAAATDNAKDGNLFKAGFNEETLSKALTMLMLGTDLKSVIYYLNINSMYDEDFEKSIKRIMSFLTNLNPILNLTSALGATVEDHEKNLAYIRQLGFVLNSDYSINVKESLKPKKIEKIINFVPVILNNPLLLSNLNNYLKVLSLSSNLFIKQSFYVQAIVNKFNAFKLEKKIAEGIPVPSSNEIVKMLTPKLLKSYKEKHGRPIKARPELFFTDNANIKSFKDYYYEVKDKYKDIKFFKFVTLSRSADNAGYVEIQFNTFSKTFTPELLEELQDDLKMLIYNETDFAFALRDYIFTKDAFSFRNNTLSKILPTDFFEDLSNAFTEFQKEMNIPKDDKSFQDEITKYVDLYVKSWSIQNFFVHYNNKYNKGSNFFIPYSFDNIQQYFETTEKLCKLIEASKDKTNNGFYNIVELEIAGQLDLESITNVVKNAKLGAIFAFEGLKGFNFQVDKNASGTFDIKVNDVILETVEKEAGKWIIDTFKNETVANAIKYLNEKGITKLKEEKEESCTFINKNR
jgi:hypothetical protein